MNQYTSVYLMDHKDRLCMYFWIVQGPAQKKMRKGKAAGQVAHAAARLARLMTDDEWVEYIEYEVKIVYKVSTPEKLLELSEKTKLIGERNTIIYDNTWGMYTVYGMISRYDPNKDKEWKLA